MAPDNPEQKIVRQTAERLADAARPIALRYFRKSALGVENKDPDGFDPVTKADREIELEMRRILAEACPEDGILGEEFANLEGSSGRRWVLDPIDGTKGFVCGTPVWGVLVAASRSDGPEFGLIDQPFTQERFWGGYGEAGWQCGTEERRLNVSGTTALSEAILCTTGPELFAENEQPAFGAVASRCRLVRYGMDCYAYGLLAAGHVDLVIESGLNAFDIQAPIAVIEGAGGIVTNWSGGPAHDGGQAVAAATRELHDQALELLKDAASG